MPAVNDKALMRACKPLISMLLCTISLAIPVASAPDLRAPFVLELPELGNTIITAVEANIPTANLQTLRLQIRNPFADSIPYSKIFVTINGESANTITSIRAGREGHLVICDLAAKPRFRLRSGKNVVEINALSREGINYYASYVLLVGGAAPDAYSATIEYFPTFDSKDPEPPTICLEPNSTLKGGSKATTIRIGGLVSDNSKIVSITLNGQAIKFSPVEEQSRKLILSSPCTTGDQLFSFSHDTKLDRAPFIIEAKDSFGNITRITIPVRRSEPVIPSQFKGRKLAVIIGVSKYKYRDAGLNDLRFADADVRSIRDFLKQPDGGRFSDSDMIFLENEQASIEAVRAALQWLVAQARAEDLIFLFIAGHGAPDPYAPQNLYFLLHDTKATDMPATALSMSDLKRALDSARAQRIIALIDTCHSAGLSGTKFVEKRSLALENNIINLYTTKLFSETGRALITSSDVNEVSLESDRWGGGHGIFTWALLEGLRGEADTNNDRLITVGELFPYLRDRVRFETAFTQNPQALPGNNSDFTIAVVPGKKK